MSTVPWSGPRQRFPGNVGGNASRGGAASPAKAGGLAELDELHSRLKAAFEARRLTIPRLPILLRELAAYEYAITDRGNLTLHARRDDHVDSFALAARPLPRPRSEPGPPASCACHPSPMEPGDGGAHDSHPFGPAVEAPTKEDLAELPLD